MTLFMVVQAALAVLLSRLGAGTDIPVGTPVAGRTDTALEELVGFFVNTLVLRTDLSGIRRSPSCWAGSGRPAWARWTIRTCRSSGWWSCSRRSAPLARHPLFQVNLTLQKNAPAVLDLPGVRAAGLRRRSRYRARRPGIHAGRGTRREGRPAGAARVGDGCG